MSKLSHVGEDGHARMVDVSDKAATHRVATAAGFLRCRAETLDRVRAGTTPKGAVIQTAELAGTMAAKRTADLIPLCHPLALTKVTVTIEPDDALTGFRIASEVRCHGVTGVEMEALTAVSIAGLTLFDMLKAVDRTMEIGGIAVTGKTGGKSESW
ncbi:MAG TPA: cyclic pyranopterin monophosphate synthase MoaC [Allosphingosinicella sp.]|nr:cyclic pyranopterin monophosphate synthase MoaC [Allosphingosinicella sp.]